jgi:hypothetical protein
MTPIAQLNPSTPLNRAVRPHRRGWKHLRQNGRRNITSIVTDTQIIEAISIDGQFSFVQRSEANIVCGLVTTHKQGPKAHPSSLIYGAIQRYK